MGDGVPCYGVLEIVGLLLLLLDRSDWARLWANTFTRVQQHAFVN